MNSAGVVFASLLMMGCLSDGLPIPTNAPALSSPSFSQTPVDTDSFRDFAFPIARDLSFSNADMAMFDPHTDPLPASCVGLENLKQSWLDGHQGCLSDADCTYFLTDNCSCTADAVNEAGSNLLATIHYQLWAQKCVPEPALCGQVCPMSPVCVTGRCQL